MVYDVIVVGAGPGGATSARYLARMGFKVCLLDKDNFPRDKPCGGGFSYNIIKKFPYLKSREDEFLDAVCRVGVIHSPNGRIRLRGNVDMAVALRSRFDNVLLNEAVSEGSDVKVGTRVKAVKIDSSVSIVTNKGERIEGKVLIGADGPTSLVARQTGLHRKWHSKQVTVCRVAEVPLHSEQIEDIYGNHREYHFYANFRGQPGYGWIFPKLNTINIGLGIVGHLAAGLPRRFKRFSKHLRNLNLLPNGADLSQARGAIVPTSGPIEKTFSNRLLLVGDSAGMVSPLTGGGIDYAMRAGRLAALVLRQALENDTLDDTFLSKYQNLWMNDFGKEFGPQLLAQKIFTSPFTDILFEIGRRDEKLQEMVSQAMTESSEKEINVSSLVVRTLLTCLRSGLHL